MLHDKYFFDASSFLSTWVLFHVPIKRLFIFDLFLFFCKREAIFGIRKCEQEGN